MNFSFRKFKFEIIGITSRNKLGWCEDVTMQLKEKNSLGLNEYIFSIKTKRKNVSLLIFSSVDINSDRSRDTGSDAIRLIYMYTIGDEVKFIKVKHSIYRTDNVFKNLEKYILDALNDVYYINL